MKKKIAMAAMALAVSAMAGSAFAADEPAKSTKTIAAMELVDANAVPAKLIQIVQQGGTTPFPDLKQLANEKGISVEELIKQLEKEGKIKIAKAEELQQADGTLAPADTTPVAKIIDLEQMAKEKGISVEELKAQLQARFKALLDPAGNLSQAIKVTPAIPFQK